MKKLSQLLSVVFIFLFLNNAFAQDAVYKIEFISNWTSTTHPTDYPSGAHWSPLIGTTHKDATPFFQLGMLASDGVEQVAENGSNTTITQEINAIIGTGNAYEVISGSGLGTGPGTITINDVNVDADFPYISLITMIAPSPDWIAQINNEKLTENNGDWKTSISVEVYATDAGTDNGTTYASSNDNTNPAENMSSLQDTAPFSDQIVGTFIFTLQQVLAIDNHALQNAISIYPNPNNGDININNTGNIVLEKAEIYTVTGKKVWVFNNIINQKSLTFNSLKSGLYFLKLDSDKGGIVKKLIIQ
jgi:hypothetical protein